MAIDDFVVIYNKYIQLRGNMKNYFGTIIEIILFCSKTQEVLKRKESLRDNPDTQHWSPEEGVV